MDWSLLIEPYTTEEFNSAENKLISNISFYDRTQELGDYSIAIVGICEDRESLSSDSKSAVKRIRNKLYSLSEFSKNISIIDVGDIKTGNTYKDSCIAIIEVMQALLPKGLSIVTIGGGNNLASLIANVLIENQYRKIVISSIDSVLSFGKKQQEQEGLLGESKLYSLATQRYFINENDVDLWKKRGDVVLRLGEIRDRILNAEPLLRDSDYSFFCNTALRYADCMNKTGCSPNGLYAEEACQLAMYAGLSDTNKIWSYFNIDLPEEDIITSAVTSQILWHYLEGISQRKNDYPLTPLSNYKMYIVDVDGFEEGLVFYESPKSGRWWIQCCGGANVSLVACLYEDYLSACGGKVPDVWYREYSR